MHRALVAGLLMLGLSGAGPVLAAPLPVRGTVRQAGGAPLKGARVELSPVLSNHAWNALLLRGELRPPVVAEAETDEAGRFSLAAPSGGVWRVEVRAAGFVPVRWFPLPVSGEVELPPVELVEDAGVQIETAAGVIVVAETESGDPWAGSRGWSAASRNGIPDASGRLRLPRAAGETLRLTALRPGSLAAARGRAEARARLVPGAAGVSRSLAVRDPEGSPLTGLVVVAGEPAWPLGRTDGQGLLAFDANPEAVTLHLFAEDGRRWQADLPPRPQDGGAAVLVLPAPAWVSGRVLDAASRRPLAGARVWPGHDPGASATTGADGRYRLAAPPGERFWIQAEAAGRLPETAWVTRTAAAAGQAPTLALAVASSAAGQVVDPAGKPVPGAEVAAFMAASQRSGFRLDAAEARAVTDAAGRFALAGLPAQGAVEVTVVRRGFLPAREALARQAGLRIVLERSRAGHGRVVDAGDLPVPGVEVRISPSGGRGGTDRDRPAAVTDGDGRFRFEELPARELDLEARKPGFAPRIVRRLPVPPAGEGAQGAADLGTLVLHPGAAVRGRVTDAAGQPLAGAEVWVIGDDGGPPPTVAQIAQGKAAATGDREGRFAVEDLEAGRRIHLAAGRTGYVAAAVRGVEVPTGEPVVLVLEEAARVSGEVVTAEGEPVAGAAVVLGGRSLPAGTVGLPMRSPELARRAAADAAGRFVLEDVASGEAELRAEAEGFQPPAPVPLKIVRGQAVDGVRIVLAPGAVLAGTVSVRDSGPAEGARVTAGPAATVTDADGLYRLSGIPPGPRQVEVRHPGSKRLVQRMEIAPGANAADFVLDGGQPVSGRVTDEEGNAVEAARVEIRLQDPWDPHAYQEESDADGGFLFPAVASGLYDLRAGSPGYAETESATALRVEARPVPGVSVVLRPGATVSGRLLGLGFEELAAAQVAAETADGASRNGIVDYQGRYEIADLSPGDWLVRGSVRGRDRQAEARVAIASGAREVERDLRFGGGLALSGSVSHGGAPLPEARIAAHGLESALVRSGMTDRRGWFRLEGLEPGRYRLSIASARELLSYNELVEVLSDREVAIDIPTAQISGAVVSEPRSRPVPKAVVYLQQLVGDEADQPASVVNVITDDAGQFRMARVLAGRHRLLVREAGYAPAEQVVEVQAGASLDGVEIRLAPAGGLEAVVRLASGRVPAAAAIAAFDAAGRQVAAEGQSPDAAGRVRFALVPPGTREVLVTATGGVSVRVPVEVPGPPVEVVLPDAGRMRVRVPALIEANSVATLVLLAPDGRPFEALNAFGQLQREWLLPGGSGVVEGLPPGPWHARATAPDGQIREGEAVVVAGGESELVLP